MTVSTRRHRGMTSSQKATIFGACMITMVCFSLFMAVLNSDPIVLGTEINTNGQMEYLCLGRTCEDVF